ERWVKWRRRQPHALGRALAVVIAAAGLLLAAAAVGGDARQRARRAERFLADGRNEQDAHNYEAAAKSFERGLALIEPIRYWPHTKTLRVSLLKQLQLSHQSLLADELHALAD